jgi:hypothetical protein
MKAYASYKALRPFQPIYRSLELAEDPVDYREYFSYYMSTTLSY